MSTISQLQNLQSINNLQGLGNPLNLNAQAAQLGGLNNFPNNLYGNQAAASALAAQNQLLGFQAAGLGLNGFNNFNQLNLNSALMGLNNFPMNQIANLQAGLLG